ncbi:potassium channel family protein [Rathayibacter tritici]|uniref:potassium channel family protein n=1 Tax=Rathayibacter tritici TaxID=33888 RepID=UPI000AB1B459|nr:potassium channel family protein [Rathayibacter tritici]
MASLAVLDAERDTPGALITTFDQALWWAFVTITTVGYGDLYPVTGTGRFIAAGIMLGGIAMSAICRWHEHVYQAEGYAPGATGTHTFCTSISR